MFLRLGHPQTMQIAVGVDRHRLFAAQLKHRLGCLPGGKRVELSVVFSLHKEPLDVVYIHHGTELCGMSNGKWLCVTGTVRADTRRKRQSSHCVSNFHFQREPDEKPEGSFLLTLTRQKSILRGSEIFGYDEKEYPERMLQRTAGWCKAVQGVRGKILSELSG